MQNKTKLFLVILVVFWGGILIINSTDAATTYWCCVPPAGNACNSIASPETCEGAGYAGYALRQAACSTVSGCSQNSAAGTSTTYWCCVPPAGDACNSIVSPETCEGAGYTGYALKKSACSTVSGCSQNSNSSGSCSTVCVPSASCTKKTSGTCSTSGYVCCDSSSGGGGSGGGLGGGAGGTGVIIPTQLAGLPTNPNLVKGIFTNVANFLLSIIGIIAIIAFVISGIQYFLVATDEKKMETAKKTMMASIIGLVVALFGYIAVKTVEMLLKG